MKSTARTTGIEGRIVNLSSIAHLHTYENGIKFDGINDEKRYAIFKELLFLSDLVYDFIEIHSYDSVFLLHFLRSVTRTRGRTANPNLQTYYMPKSSRGVCR